ncbi:MAG: AAA family ATPase [Alphaproteobacteria bacterium]|nr:AAA family ATPase [Alphaproteobacteria bacterium]MDX5416139.1 AAA family ATPase [Alphaproteobacteria bacterium]MDX5493445.1 AAA family ATPase [Alphaproteobacteria bacterium]
MEISARDFRSFHEIGPIEIKPITLLVGENSAGKTSFLSLVRFAHEILGPTGGASFNKPPFFLGAYDQIAHYRGGKFGRAKTFSISVTETIRTASVRGRDKSLPNQVNARLTISFKKEASQPVISRVEFSAKPYGFDIKIGEKTSFEVTGPDEKQTTFINVRRPYEFLGRNAFDITSIYYLVRELQFSEISSQPSLFGEAKVEGGGSLRESVAARIVVDLFERFRRTVTRPAFAAAPVRTEARRVYTPTDENPAPDGNHVPMLLARVKALDPEQWKSLKGRLDEFGKLSGLFESVDIKQLGRSESDPFQISVKIAGPASNIVDVGYGVSQILPLIVELVRNPKSRRIFLLQQPEVHLHPRAQAALGTFFSDFVSSTNMSLVVETHSDYIVDRIRMETRDKSSSRSKDVQVLYFDRKQLNVKVHQISIDSDGNLKNVPKGYRDFFLSEERRLLGI